MGALTTEQTSRLLEILAPLIGMQGHCDHCRLEVVEVLDEGPEGLPSLALMEVGSDGAIQANQYGNPLCRRSQIRTIPLLSEVEDDLHPVLRSLLPKDVVSELRTTLAH